MASKRVLIPAVLLTVSVAAVLLFLIYDDVQKHKAFESVETDLCDWYMDGFDLRGELCMYNPNDIEAVLDRVDVRVHSGDNKIADIVVPKNISIPPMSRASTDIDIDLDLSGLVGAGLDWLTGDSTAMTVRGTAYYDSILGTFKQDFVKHTDGSGSSESIEQICVDLIDDAIERLEFMPQAAEWLRSNGYAANEANMDWILEEWGTDDIISDAMDATYDAGCVDPHEGIINSPYVSPEQRWRIETLFGSMQEYLP